MASFVDMWEAGGQAARQDQQRKALRDYLQPAAQGDSGAITQLYNAGLGDQAMQLQDRAGSQKQAKLEQLGKFANAYVQTRDPMIWKQMHPLMVEATGRPDLPLDLTDPADIEGSLKASQSVAAMYGDAKQAEQFTLAPGSARYDASGRQIAAQPFQNKPEYQLYDSADGPVWLPKPTAGGAPQQGQGAPIGGAAGVLMGGSFDAAVQPLLDREGGYIANDAGAGPTNFGINSRANPDVNVASLDRNAATQIYRKRYWDAIGADQLPPQIREAAFDTAVNMGPEVAKQLIQQSGGDPQRFAMLRQQRYDGLVASNPQKYGQYADSWAQRNQQTAGIGAIPISGVRPKPKADGAPAGYRWSDDGTHLEPIPGGPADRKNNPTASDQAKGEMALRKELSDRLKEPRSVMTMFQKVQAAGSQPSAANDLAMIFAYMKMLDPGSVVREQEFANAQNAAGVPDQVRNAYNKAMRGERLNENQRNQFISSAQQVANLAEGQITHISQEYQGIADQYGYDPSRASGMPDFRNVDTGQPGAQQDAGGNNANVPKPGQGGGGTVWTRDASGRLVRSGG